MKRLHTALSLLVLVVLTGCRSGGGPSVALVPDAGEPDLSVVWVRDSAEYYVASHQAYRLATERLEASVKDREAGTWAVSLDADETLLSNLGYSLRRVKSGGKWERESWRRWVLDREAPSMPGAVDFVATVHRLGGRVAVVTNRNEDVCEATRENLTRVGIRFDVVLCQGDDRLKDSRWRAVETGEGTELGPLEIVMWVGDNIFDFPGMSQESRGVEAEELADFGSRYILLPNPIYGSWEE